MPNDLSVAIRSMIDLFADRQQRDVGGWALPYLLTAAGAHFCFYAYSVSDPVFDQLAPGSIVGHGTPEGGGSTLSVTELGHNDGMVVHRLQLPGGVVLQRTPEGYVQHSFRGGPSEFEDAVRAALSREVELFVGDQPLGPAQRLTVMRGKDGNIDLTIADHGNGLTFAVHNMHTAFQSTAKAAIGVQAPLLPSGIAVRKISNNQVELSVDGCARTLDTAGVEALRDALADLRTDMIPEVPYDLANVGVH
jgi:hypothetical protein